MFTLAKVPNLEPSAWSLCFYAGFADGCFQLRLRPIDMKTRRTAAWTVTKMIKLNKDSTTLILHEYIVKWKSQSTEIQTLKPSKSIIQ